MKRIAISILAALSLTACLDDERTDEPETEGVPTRPESDRPDGVEETFEIGTTPQSLPKGIGSDGRYQIRFPDENGECCIVLRYAPAELKHAGRI